MDFFSIVMFLGLYYIRPQEWIPFVFQLQPIKVTMILALISMASKYREHPFFKDLFRTPHDWIMLVYFIWLVATAPSIGGAFLETYRHLLYYLVTVQALSNIRRIQSYLNWWTFFIFAVAMLALAAEYGFDPMDSYSETHGGQKGRLILNSSIFNNPNALGHSIVPAIVMLYFLLFWKRPVFMKIATIPVMFFPLYCIFLTLSKGAFLSGFATVVSALTFRRPKAIQLLIFVSAFTLGFAALKTLPRMQELDDSKAEGGIQGRIAAFQYGNRMMKEHVAGVGYQHFIYEFEELFGYMKAPHSSYVQVGGELGFIGLFLFLGILYCCLRTLITTQTADDAEERVRRILFVLLISFMVSSWMVGWSYRASFFLMAAVIAAFHRQMLLRASLPENEDAIPVANREPVLAIGGREIPLRRTESGDPAPAFARSAQPKSLGSEEPDLEVADPGIRWNKIEWLDLGLIALMLIATVTLWGLIMNNM